MAIPTGGMLPEGADAAVMLEYTEQPDAKSLLVQKMVAPFENVVRRGEEIAAGTVLVEAGVRLCDKQGGLLAACGCSRLWVKQRLKVALLSTGTPLPTTVRVGEMLRARGIAARVVSFHTVKPLDEALLTEVFDTCAVVTTIEEHSVLGGLGGAVAEWLSDRSPRKARLLRLCTGDEFLHVAADEEYARHHFGLDADGMTERIAAAFDTASRRA